VVSATLGAMVVFVAAKSSLGPALRTRAGPFLDRLAKGFEDDAFHYLLFLRLVPAFPFFIVNLVMGLTPMRTTVFALVSQLGMLPGTIVYVNAGTQLGRIESLQGILSPALIGSFVLLGIFPLLAKRVVGAVQARRNVRRDGGTRSEAPVSRPESDSL